MKHMTLALMALLGALSSIALGGTVRYHLDRVVGAGTVTGWIETDGTTGVLSAGNITDYELTVSAPNLRAGPTVVLTPANQGQLLIFGDAVTASASALSYDFGDANGDLFLIQGNAGVSSNFWCLESLLGGCTTAGQGENIGFASDNSNVAQSRSPVPTGVEVFARSEITYIINRSVGNGFVNGTITTNGTIGVLDTSDIIDWELDLYAPGMADGDTDSIDFPTSFQTIISGTGTIATPTELRFDFGASGFFLMQGFTAGGGGFGNFYCIEVSGCTSGGTGEHIGQEEGGGNVAQTTPGSGVVTFATVAGPAPITYTINRIVDEGQIWGTITTNGTLGVLRVGDIIDWTLTLCSPGGLFGDVTIDTITKSDKISTQVVGDTTIASSSDLMFDISGALGEGFILMQGTSFNFYCLETAFGGCVGLLGEHIGWDSEAFVPAETAQPTGMFSFATTNPDPITYTVQRRIGAGTVTGTITTDGTMGTLTAGSIIDFDLALRAPNLEGGPNQTITPFNVFQFGPSSTQLSATPGGLFFDISGASGEGFFLFQNNTGGTGFGHYWCIETALGACTGLGQGEYMGFSNTGATAAQSASRSGVVRVATTCPADLNGDGALDFFDVSAFLQALMNNNPIADFNNDGMFDFFDVSSFLQQLQMGCPC